MTKPTLLVIDDSKSQCVFYQSLLGSTYHTLLSQDGEQALEMAIQHNPDIILLDIEMPNMNGYEVCEKLRQRDQLTPVIFVSGKTDLDQRLRAYDAGGNDFIGKPLGEAELLRKIALSLTQRKEEQRLREDGQLAFATAITAMTTMSEMGVLIDFLRNCGKYEDYQAIANGISHTLQVYGLHGCMQIYGKQGQLRHATQGQLTPLETSIIASSLTLPRISNSGSSTSFNYPQCCLIVRDMPQDDEERCGRLRDHLAILAEVAASHVAILDEQQQQLADARDMLQKSRSTLLQLRKSLPASCTSAGLNAEQQLRLIKQFDQQLMALSQQHSQKN